MIDLDQLERDIAAMNATLTVPTIAAMQHHMLLQAKVINMLSHNFLLLQVSTINMLSHNHPSREPTRESRSREDS